MPHRPGTTTRDVAQIHIPNTVSPWRRPHLRFVLLCLAYHAEQHDGVPPSTATLCRYTDMPEPTVRGCLRTLTDLGLIEQEGTDL